MLSGVMVAAIGVSAASAAPRRHAVEPVVVQALTPPPVGADPFDPAAVLEVACEQCASSEVVGLLYREVLRVPFVVGEGVEADRRMVSVDIRGTPGQLADEATAYLAGLGYVDHVDRGVHQVSLPPPPAPPKPPPPPPKPRMVYSVYHPHWRDPSELGRMLSPLFPEGRFSAGGGSGSSSLPVSSSMTGQQSQGASLAGGSGSAMPSTTSLPNAPSGGAGGADSLVFYGTLPDQARLLEVLPQVDTAEAEVMVKATVFEVDVNTDEGSAFNLALNLLKSKLSVGLNSSATTSLGGLATSAATAAATGGSSLAGNFISFQNNSIDAVVTALADDQRFHVVTSPAVRARSGSSTQFIVGQQVPVIGQVAYAGVSAAPVQSVNYMNSGVVFNVRPVVHNDVIDIDVHQEISSFVNTTTGVNNTPTRQDREIEASLSVQDGTVICMGGLTQSNIGKTKSGLPGFLSFMGSNEKTDQRTDVLLVLQVVKLNNADGSPTPDELSSRRAVPRPPALPYQGVVR